MNMIDTHIHVDFYENRINIIKSIEEYGIYSVFVTHLPELFEKYYEIEEIKSKYIRLALGFHPILIHEYDFDKELFLRMLDYTKYIGEVGLDYAVARSQKSKDLQQSIFNFICQSTDNTKIFSVHSRQAEEDVFKILVRNDVKRAIFHWYTGNEEMIRDIIAAGFYFSINPMMLRNIKGRNIIKKIPIDRLLIESDGPFSKIAGKLVEPSNINEVYKAVGTFLGIDNLSSIVYTNFNRILS